MAHIGLPPLGARSLTECSLTESIYTIESCRSSGAEPRSPGIDSLRSEVLSRAAEPNHEFINIYLKILQLINQVSFSFF